MRRLVRLSLQAIGVLALFGTAIAAAAFFFLAPLLQAEQRIGRADYILPLAGDGHRLIRAAELYRDGMAPKILLSIDRRPPRSRLQEIAAGMGYPPPDARAFPRELLAHLGVPETAVEAFGDGHMSTVEEAEALRRHFGNRRATVLMVTAPFHSRRAMLVFERALPDVRWLLATTPEGSLPERWWTDRDAALNVVLESAKFVHYWLGGAFRAAEPASR